MEFLIKFIGVFVLTVIVDYAWSAYVQSVQVKSKLVASLWATTLMVLSGFVTVSFVKDPLLLIPAGLGAFVGTWISFKKEHNAN
jgi:hypothetical protein